MNDRVPPELVARHRRFVEYAENASAGIGRSHHWRDLSPEFRAELTRGGYRNLGAQNYLPTMLGRPLADQFPSEASNKQAATPDAWAEAYETVTAEWSTALRYVDIDRPRLRMAGTDLAMNWQTVDSLYAFKLIHHFSGGAFNADSQILEIGAGSGHLSALFAAEYGARLVIVDLPEMMTVSSAYLATLFAERTIVFANEVEAGTDIDNADIVFLLPHQVGRIAGRPLDLAMNVTSFTEMRVDEVDGYFELIGKQLRIGGYFYNANRSKHVELSEMPWSRYAQYEIVSRAPNRLCAMFPPWSEGGAFEIPCDLRRKTAEITPSSDSLDALLADIDHQLAVGRHGDAERLCGEAIALTADDLRPRVLLARVLHGDGRLREAVATLRRAIAMAPEEADGRVLFARYLMEQYRRDIARGALYEPFKFSFAWGDFAYPQGFNLPDSPRAEAMDALRATLRIDPAHARANTMLGRMLLEDGADTTDAGAHCQAGAGEAPDDPDGHHAMALLGLRMGNPDLARKAIANALVVDPTRADAQLLSEALAFVIGDGAFPLVDDADIGTKLALADLVFMLSPLAGNGTVPAAAFHDLSQRLLNILMSEAFDCLINRKQGFLGSRFLKHAATLAPEAVECSFLAGCLLDLSGDRCLAQTAMAHAKDGGMSHEWIDRVLST